MQKKKSHSFIITAILAVLSVLFTILVRKIDVDAIGPNKSEIGFSGLNSFIHELSGVNMLWYHITDWLGLVPVFTAFIFAIVGLCQLVKRKNLFKVDSSIIILGCFYIIVIAIYIFFESCIINYRPILINGILEASYPSSHTLMTICLMYAAVTECDILIKNKKTNRIIRSVSYLIIAITVIGRLISGVHWFTDIIGGILISSALIMFYNSVLYHFEHTINKFK